MVNIPYDPVLHDLSITPRNMTAMEIVEFWLGNILPYFHICQMFVSSFTETLQTFDVADWYERLDQIDIPSIQFTFAGIFGHILLLEVGYNNTLAIGTPFMGMGIYNMILKLQIFNLCDTRYSGC